MHIDMWPDFWRVSKKVKLDINFFFILPIELYVWKLYFKNISIKINDNYNIFKIFN